MGKRRLQRIKTKQGKRERERKKENKKQNNIPMKSCQKDTVKKQINTLMR